MEYLVLDLICWVKKLPSQLTPSNPKNTTNRQASMSVSDKKLNIKVLLLGPVIENPNKPGKYMVEDHQDQKSSGTLSPTEEPIKWKMVFHYARGVACADARYKNKEGVFFVGEQSSLYILANWSKKTVSCLRNTEDLWEGINARQKKQSQLVVNIPFAIGSKKAADTIYSP
jgi:hypothetical protein